MATRMQQRRGTASQWISTNGGDGPVLNAGEIGFESDTNKFKIGDGINHWVDLDYFTTDSAEAVTAEVEAAINALIGGAPGTLDTLNELAAAINDDPAVFTTIATNLSNHQSDTTNIHGIADTSLLATTANVATAKSEAISTASSDATTKANAAQAAAETTAANALSSHESDTTNVHGITDTAALATRTYADNAASQAVAALVASAPSTLNTLNELSAAIANNPNYATDVANLVATKADTTYVDTEITNAVNSGGQALSDHSSDTTGIHGIADTSLLATQEYVIDAIANSTDSYPELAGDGIAWNAGTLAFDVDNTVARTSATDLLASIEYVDDEITSVRDDAAVAAASLLTGATKYNITITGDKDGLTITAENGVAESTTDNLSEGTNNLYFNNERAQDAVGNSVGTGLSYNDATGAVSVDTTAIQARVADVSDTEIGYLNGVTSSVQTQIDTKAPTANPTFTGTVAGVTKAMVGLGNADNTSDANKPVSTATQTELDLKAPKADPTFTGTVSGVTKAHVGLANADNTSDANKPVSTATQTALDLKAPLASPTFTGTVTSTGALIVEGNLTVSGTTTTVNASDLSITDPLIYLASNQYTEDVLDVGFMAATGAPGGSEASHLHSGFFRDASDSKKWKLVSNVPHPVNNVVDITNATRETLVVGALEATSATIGDVSNTELQYLNGVTSAVQTQIDSKAPLASPTFTGTVTIPNGAALGTPASGTLTNATGLPVASGISGLGTGVATFLATPSSANLASMLTDEIGTGNIVLSEVATSPQNASYILVAADRGKLVEMNVGSANTLTVPLNSSVPFPIGTQIDILQVGSGRTTVAGATVGVTINATPGLAIRAQWGGATLIKRGENTWVLIGDLTTV
jgi:hypothetical protein